MVSCSEAVAERAPNDRRGGLALLLAVTLLGVDAALESSPARLKPDRPRPRARIVGGKAVLVVLAGWWVSVKKLYRGYLQRQLAASPATLALAS